MNSKQKNCLNRRNARKKFLFVVPVIPYIHARARHSGGIQDKVTRDCLEVISMQRLQGSHKVTYECPQKFQEGRFDHHVTEIVHKHIALVLAGGRVRARQTITCVDVHRCTVPPNYNRKAHQRSPASKSHWWSNYNREAAQPNLSARSTRLPASTSHRCSSARLRSRAVFPRRSGVEPNSVGRVMYAVLIPAK